MKKNQRIAIIVAALVVVLGAFIFYQKGGGAPNRPTLTLAEQKPTPQRQELAYETDGCVITGCNSEICADGNDGGITDDSTDTMSVCMSSPAFECYKKHGVCRRLYGDECGWDPTSQLQTCIQEKMAHPTDTTPLDQLQLPGGATVPDATPSPVHTQPKE